MLEGLDDIDWSALGHAYGEAGDVPGQIRALASEDETIRQQALWSLFGNIYHQGTVYQATAPAVPFLVELASHPDVRDRPGIFGLIAAIAEGSSYLDVHGDLSGDRDRTETEEFQAELSEELAHVRAAREAVLAGVPAYLGSLDDPDAEVRVHAAYLLGRLPEAADRTVDPLKARVESETDPKARSSALLALGALFRGRATGMDQDRFREIAEGDGPAVVRLAAGLGLARTGFEDRSGDLAALVGPLIGPARVDYESLPWSEGNLVDEIGQLLTDRPASRLAFAIASLSDPEEQVRQAGISAIRDSCLASRSAPAVAAPALADRLGDRANSVRIAAVTELGQIGRSAALVADRLAEALKDRSKEVTIRAALALGKIRDVRSIPRLIQGLDNQRWGDDSAEILGQFGPAAAEAVPALLLALDRLPSSLTAHWNVPIAAAIALGKIGRPAEAAIPALIDRMRHPGIRRACAIAFRSFGPAAVAALPALRALANDRDEILRSQVAMAIWAITGEADEATAILTELPDFRSGGSSLTVEALGEIGPAAEAALPTIIDRLGRSPSSLNWDRGEEVRAAWRIGRRADIALPVCLSELPRLAELGFEWARSVVQTLGEMGPIAFEALPRLREYRAQDARLADGGDLDSIIEEDEAFLDDLDRAIASIEGDGHG